MGVILGLVVGVEVAVAVTVGVGVGVAPDRAQYRYNPRWLRLARIEDLPRELKQASLVRANIGIHVRTLTEDGIDVVISLSLDHRGVVPPVNDFEGNRVVADILEPCLGNSLFLHAQVT